MRGMIMMLATVCGVVLVLASVGRGAETEPGKKAANLILFDKDGKEVAKFVMAVTPTKEKNQKFEGKLGKEWMSEKFKNGGACGEKFFAEIEGADFRADMNPGVADNNVFLNGKVGEKKVTGEWSFSSFVGGKVGGKFELSLGE